MDRDSGGKFITGLGPDSRHCGVMVHRLKKK